MIDQKKQHWIDRWNRLKPSPKREMKLYTEEQLRQAIEMARTGVRSDDNIIGSLNFIRPPMELPSDEEIEKFAFEKYHEIEDSRWFEPLQVGAKWMRDKLTNTKEK